MAEMIFDFKLTGGPYGDATSRYDVIIKKKGATISDLIEEAVKVKSDDWGTIYIGKQSGNAFKFLYSLEYFKGEIKKDDIPDEIKKQPLTKVKANGGWSMMNYDVYIDDVLADIAVKAKVFTENTKGESAEEILAEMRGEEPVSEDLEKEINKEIVKLHTAPCYDELKAFALHFAEWQKKKMMKDAVEASENLEEAANKYIRGRYSPWLYKSMFDCFKSGAQWLKNKIIKED